MENVNIAANKTVHVTVPVSLANNLQQMQKITKTVLGRLGHASCHSGFDIRFIQEWQFSFNEKGQMIER